MARDALPLAEPPPLWRRPPWVLAGVAVGLSLVGLVLSSVDLSADGPRVAVLAASLLAAGVAVWRRLAAGLGDGDERLEAAGMTLVAALAVLLDGLAFGDSWDSGRMFAFVLAAFGVFAAVLIVVSAPLRKLLISLLILFHFGGIVTAITAVAPQNQPAPWLSIMAWSHVYRGYLGFMYLNNAYHFYSPEPGPATMLWYQVEYASGKKSDFVKLPDRATDPQPMHYQRLLGLTESLNRLVPPSNIDPASWAVIQERRQRAILTYGIPLHPNPQVQQYLQPELFSQRMASSYARHIARTAVNPDDPNDKVVRVRLYRVTHSILDPAEVSAGADPCAPERYLPYYIGEFDTDGYLTCPTVLSLRGGRTVTGIVREETGDSVTVLVDGREQVVPLAEIEKTLPSDPLLYWLIPIFKDPDNPRVVQNYLKVHAQMPSPTKLNERVQP